MEKPCFGENFGEFFTLLFIVELKGRLRDENDDVKAGLEVRQHETNDFPILSLDPIAVNGIFTDLGADHHGKATVIALVWSKLNTRSSVKNALFGFERARNIFIGAKAIFTGEHSFV